jgi:phosphoribosylanthranilate isomerase
MCTKICGITQLHQGQAIAQLGASALGFICVPQSPRYISPTQIRDIADGLASLELVQPVERIGVFVDAALEEIRQTVQLGNLSGVQLHGSESVEFCQQLRAALPRITLIKAFRVRNSTTLERALTYETEVDALLLDAYHPNATHPGLYGGTGQTLDWSALQQFRPACAWLLAGGLTPDNVMQALSVVQPDGIDISSGVEMAPGDKDLLKVTALLAQVRQHRLDWNRPAWSQALRQSTQRNG